MSVGLVMEASPWAFEDDKGKAVSGVTLDFYDMETPIIHPTRKGYQKMKISGGDQVAAAVGPIPGWYAMEFRMRPNRETGKAELQLSSLELVQGLAIPADVGSFS